MKHLRILVCNDSPVLHSLAINLASKLVRNETMEGRAYKVAPMVMMVEGVLNGSQGPVMYQAEDIRKGVNVWDHKPVVVYHPEKNGSGISACSPEVLTNQKVGVILNTKVDNKGPGGKCRLTAEAWIEAERVTKVDKRVANTLAKQLPMELSTGLFMDMEPVENGEYDGKPYSFIARNFRPDHLALLPDKKGACSLKDGAGFIRNDGDEAEGEEEVESADGTEEIAVNTSKEKYKLFILNKGVKGMKKGIRKAKVLKAAKKGGKGAGGKFYIRHKDGSYHMDPTSKGAAGRNATHNPARARSFSSADEAHAHSLKNLYTSKKGYDVTNQDAMGQDAKIAASSIGVSPYNPATLPEPKKKKKKGVPGDMQQRISVFQANKMSISHSDHREEVQRQLARRFPEKGCYVCDVYPTHVVFTCGYGSSSTCQKLSYSTDKTGNVTLSDEQPTDVRRFTQYATKEGKTVSNAAKSFKEKLKLTMAGSEQIGPKPADLNKRKKKNTADSKKLAAMGNIPGRANHLSQEGSLQKQESPASNMLSLAPEKKLALCLALHGRGKDKKKRKSRGGFKLGSLESRLTPEQMKLREFNLSPEGLVSRAMEESKRANGYDTKQWHAHAVKIHEGIIAMLKTKGLKGVKAHMKMIKHHKTQMNNPKHAPAPIY